MNFNVYLDDELAKRLSKLAKRTGSPRDALIRRAVASWVRGAGAAWPARVLEWKGDPSATPFEDARLELAKAPADPFEREESRPARRGAAGKRAPR